MLHEGKARPDDPIAAIDPVKVVDNRVYFDPAVYRAEVERIFARAWQVVCHVSEVRRPGDYLTATVAGSPIVVVRDKDERLHAFYNTCRHRGAKVVSERCGHAAALRCPYHFWVYGLDGELIGIPGEEAYDGSGFVKERFPLAPLGCEEKLGLVFVNPDRDAMPLDEWLGPEVIETLSTPLALADFEVARYRRQELRVNWKIWAENARDGYHVPFLHPFFRKASPPGMYRLGRNGHAIQRLGMAREGMEPELWETLHRDPLPGIGETDGYIVTLFPDTTIMVRSNYVSLDVQHVRGVKELVMEGRLLAPVGETPEAHERRYRGQGAFLWDPLDTEDFPIFQTQQEGVESRGVRYSVIARGADSESGTRGDDSRLRQFWRQWRAMMSLETNGLPDDDRGH